MQNQVADSVARLKMEIQARDYEGVTTVLTRDIHTLLKHIKTLEGVKGTPRSYPEEIIPLYSNECCEKRCDGIHIMRSNDKETLFCAKYNQWLHPVTEGENTLLRCPYCLEEN